MPDLVFADPDGDGIANWETDVSTPVGDLATRAYVDGVVGSLISQLATKAPLDSPGFLNTPSAPTAPAGNSSLRLANTEFVTLAIAAGGISTSVHPTLPNVLIVADSSSVSPHPTLPNVLIVT